MSELNHNDRRIKTVPVDMKSKHLKSALSTLAPMIEKAKEEISKLPLRPVVDPVSSEEIMLRFATAEELQRIIMKTCLGRIIIQTVPVKLGVEPAVVAQIAILTPDGYVVLPGSHASQKVGEGAVELGHKQLLSAETRAIRRSLRDLGLRAEYEEYDAEEKNRLKEASEKETVEKVEDSKDHEVDLIDVDNDKSVNTDEDEDSEIPSVPKGFLGKSTKGKKTTSADKDESVEKTAKAKVIKPRARKTVSSKAKAAKQTIDFDIPSKPLDIDVNREHKDWPSINSIRYQNDLLDALGKVRAESGMTVGVMAQRVFGENHEASKRLATYTTKELEMFYQYYVILKEKI